MLLIEFMVDKIMYYFIAAYDGGGIIFSLFNEMFFILGKRFDRRIKIIRIFAVPGQLHFFFERKLLLCLRTGAEQQEQKCKNGQKSFFSLRIPPFVSAAKGGTGAVLHAGADELIPP